MAWKQSPLQLLAALSLGLSLELAMAAGLPEGAAAQNRSKSLDSTQQPRWEVSQFNPPRRGAPTTVSGGTRGGRLCNELAPLSPKDLTSDRKDPPYFGLTVDQQPTFFWHFRGSEEYVGQSVYFELVELSASGATREVYATDFNLPATAGVMGISLPPDVTLEVGKSYQWYIETTCNPNHALSETASIEGWIERIAESPELASKLDIATTPRDRAKAYAESGIWFDSLKTLAQERLLDDTPELKSGWTALLEDRHVELGDFADAPLMDCCSEPEARDLSNLN